MVYDVVNLAFEVMMWLVVIRCILSFIRHNPYQPIIRFIYDITEPIMAPFRRLLPPAGGIDFSPIIVWMVLMLLRNLVLGILNAIL
ncbi:MAG: YggT family protein [Syntrophomonadaceae bacterium]|jgi:YggT family protein|nr:YggT family protein [Syntrophomonadaceae bacterium]